MFPAHAGMNRVSPYGKHGTFYVPRTRGDEPAAVIGGSSGVLCSPHTRG